MCRAEAHQLYTRKPIFDAMGIQLVVLLNEYVDSEVYTEIDSRHNLLIL